MYIAKPSANIYIMYILPSKQAMIGPILECNGIVRAVTAQIFHIWANYVAIYGTDWCARQRFCTVKLSWAGENLGE